MTKHLLILLFFAAILWTTAIVEAFVLDKNHDKHCYYDTSSVKLFSSPSSSSSSSSSSSPSAIIEIDDETVNPVALTTKADRTTTPETKTTTAKVEDTVVYKRHEDINDKQFNYVVEKMKKDAEDARNMQSSSQETATTTTTTTTTTDAIAVDDNDDDDSESSFSSLLPSATSTKRACHLLDIVMNNMVSPVVSTLIRNGMPDDWDLFWETSSSSTSSSLATQVTLALEEMGPTYVKFGQALSSRPDIVPRSLAKALSNLQDQMQPFDTKLAKELIRKELLKSTSTSTSTTTSTTTTTTTIPTDKDVEALISSLSETPVAAASIGQVYSGYLNNGNKVAIKVQRPGIRTMVDEDTALLQTIVKAVEAIPSIPLVQPKDQQRLVSTDLSGAVEEFMSRILEELDYTNEANNIQTFGNLYSHERRNRRKGDKNDSNEEENSSDIQVVVPKVYMDFCTKNVLVMEWIDGVKLVDLESQESSRESLELIQQGIDCTLSQLLVTGVMHADPHGGNLLKVMTMEKDDGEEDGDMKMVQRLGYVDFGLLSTVPEGVRDGLVCAVAELVFSRSAEAVANLFAELQLIPEEILADPNERAALAVALNEVLSSVLQYDTTTNDDDDGTTMTTTTTIPSLRFDKLLDALTKLVPRFRFQLPPYFLNNARALGTLEGMAREIDPNFNVLQVLYPYALEQLLSNPRKSPVVEATLQNLIRSPFTGRVDKKRVQKLINDSALMTGYSKSKVIKDILASKSGPRLVMIVLQEQFGRVLNVKPLSKLSNSFRL